MRKISQRLTRIVGIAGALLSLALYIHSPSFPTPDKLFIFLLFVFMGFGQARELFKRLFPFVTVILVYESFRGLDALLFNANRPALAGFPKPLHSAY
jgi:hypothetical protein